VGADVLDRVVAVVEAVDRDLAIFHVEDFRTSVRHLARAP